jgi:hypothetical protein
MSKIEDLKKELEYRQDLYRIAKDQFEVCRENLENTQIEFRIAEVERVLEGMETLNKLGVTENFDRYITHCLNCLHGNIDGVVIAIEQNVEAAREEADRMVEE